MADKCVICGCPKLVKSHLMPAALGQDVKGADKAFWIGLDENPGKTLSQSGLFDYFLCYDHEHATKDADDYAIKFIRGFKLTADEIRERVFRRDATDNEMLIRFICSTLWRFHQSIRPETALVDVGEWGPNLRDVTFGGSTNQAPDVYMCAFHQAFVPALPNDAYALSPRPVEQFGRHSIQFSVNGLLFVTKLAHEDWSPDIQPFVLNQTPDWIASHVWPWREQHFQGLKDAIKRMMLPNDRHLSPPSEA
jgi:hypothetical protein